MAVTFGRLGTTTLNRGVNLNINSAYIPPPPPDVTPNTLDWADLSYTISTDTYIVGVQRISGISVPININISYSAVGLTNKNNLYYAKKGTNAGYTNGGSYSPLLDDGLLWIALTGDNTITVASGDYIFFYVSGVLAIGSPVTVTVTNESTLTSPGPTLDTFGVRVFA